MLYTLEGPLNLKIITLFCCVQWFLSSEVANLRNFRVWPGANLHLLPLLLLWALKKSILTYFLKQNLVSFTYDPRWFPKQSLRENFFLTRNAVDRSYRHCHLSVESGLRCTNFLITRNFFFCLMPSLLKFYWFAFGSGEKNNLQPLSDAVQHWCRILVMVCDLNTVIDKVRQSGSLTGFFALQRKQTNKQTNKHFWISDTSDATYGNTRKLINLRMRTRFLSLLTGSAYNLI